MEPSRARFYVPFEHGAWWSFTSTLIGAVAVALSNGADGWACLGLGMALLCGFMDQDWTQALLGGLLRRRSQALSSWNAWQGWALAALGLSGLALLVSRLAADLRRPWLALLGGLSLAALLALALRVLQAGRGRKSLAVSALLLAAPALAFGALAFGLNRLALGFWAWPLCYYPAATLAAQSYIRGFPQSARWAGPALAGILGLAALAAALAAGGLRTGAAASLAGALLLAQAWRLHSAIARRWREQPQGLPTGDAIRRFGREQAVFGVALSLLWVWAFLKGAAGSSPAA